ncbi:flagellar brake protein [Pantoea sp. A4]|uniref:flagellar brake protein n=1 Tax=Pantoea sp. A4 TaxID=1225184 RepID=UPI00035D565C|nr:flagellar brake protein [Pantoea sp. A4]
MTKSDKEQYIKRGTLAVLNCMRELLTSRAPLMVSFSSGQFISRMLSADDHSLYFDLGSDEQENTLAQQSTQLNISAETSGAKIEFCLPAITIDTHDGLPAFRAALPDLIWQIQRREFFRVTAPLEPTFWCTSQWPDGSKARFRLQDLSLGGIGALLDDPLPEGVSAGDMFPSLEVELGEYGKFSVAAQLLHIGERTIITSKNETRITPRLSFRFTTIAPAQARELQQVIFALERLARDKANRFQ